jgi:hypothetical protein
MRRARTTRRALYALSAIPTAERRHVKGKRRRIRAKLGATSCKDVDGRGKPGHDENCLKLADEVLAQYAFRLRALFG